jgi:hypothetical protein
MPDGQLRPPGKRWGGEGGRSMMDCRRLGIKDKIMSRQPLLLALVAGLLTQGLLAGSCSLAQPLPDGAKQALEKTWRTLPGGASADFWILRAWPGKGYAENPAPLSPAMEIWCVEISQPPGQGEAKSLVPMIWIITRAYLRGEWMAAPLMTMSSSWPYQACGAMP